MDLEAVAEDFEVVAEDSEEAEWVEASEVEDLEVPPQAFEWVVLDQEVCLLEGLEQQE